MHKYRVWLGGKNGNRKKCLWVELSAYECPLAESWLYCNYFYRQSTYCEGQKNESFAFALSQSLHIYYVTTRVYILVWPRMFLLVRNNCLHLLLFPPQDCDLIFMMGKWFTLNYSTVLSCSQCVKVSIELFHPLTSISAFDSGSLS